MASIDGARIAKPVEDVKQVELGHASDPDMPGPNNNVELYLNLHYVHVLHRFFSRLLPPFESISAPIIT